MEIKKEDIEGLDQLTRIEFLSRLNLLSNKSVSMSLMYYFVGLVSVMFYLIYLNIRGFFFSFTCLIVLVIWGSILCFNDYKKLKEKYKELEKDFFKIGKK